LEESVLNGTARVDAAAPGAAEVSRDAEQMRNLLVADLRHARTRLRREWAARIHSARLLEAMSFQQRDLVTMSVYDDHLELLETADIEVSQNFARDLSERIIARGVDPREALAIVFRLHDVLARFLFERYQCDLGLLNRVLDAYQPVADRLATAVAFTCVDERARQRSAVPDPAIGLELARMEITNLNEALSSRTTIGEAIGLLMHEKKLTAKAAFAHLIELSSHTNIKVREIAARMVEEAGARAERTVVGVPGPAVGHRRVSSMASRLR
jgi:hypothetical protein